jgi:hypothetical protein
VETTKKYEEEEEEEEEEEAVEIEDVRVVELMKLVLSLRQRWCFGMEETVSVYVCVFNECT